MKSDRPQQRFYREWVKAPGLYQSRIAVKETDLQIFTDRPVDEEFLRERVREYRRRIEGYIAKDRRFLVSLKPIPVELTAPALVTAMASAAEKAGVGPMAAVAGVVAGQLGRDLMRRGYKDIVIENGGDIFLKTTKTRTVGVYAGEGRLWNKLCLVFRPEDTPLGICTSSGTLGHSLSFGAADGVVIVARSAGLADAVATGTANRVSSRRDLPGALAYARAIKGVIGVVIFIEDACCLWGKIRFTTRA